MRLRERPWHPPDAALIHKRTMHRPISHLPALACLVMLCASPLVCAPARAEPPQAQAGPVPKADFLYNFMLFTQWPAEVGRVLNLCLYGVDSVAHTLRALQGKPVNLRTVAVQYRSKGDALHDCQLVYLANPLNRDGMRVLAELYGLPVLTVASTPGAVHLGAGLNLVIRGDQVACEINLAAVRAARIKLSAKLLYLSTEVIQ